MNNFSLFLNVLKMPSGAEVKKSFVFNQHVILPYEVHILRCSYLVGELSCVTNGDILTVDITVVKNGSNIIGVEYAQFTDWKNRYRSGDCVFTGDGSLANPFKTSIQVNISSDASTSTSSYCGHKQVKLYEE